MIRFIGTTHIEEIKLLYFSITVEINKKKFLTIKRPSENDL